MSQSILDNHYSTPSQLDQDRWNLKLPVWILDPFDGSMMAICAPELGNKGWFLVLATA